MRNQSRRQAVRRRTAEIQSFSAALIDMCLMRVRPMP